AASAGSTPNAKPQAALEFQSTFARRVGERLDATMVAVMATIERRQRDALGDGLLCELLADDLRCLDVTAIGQAGANVLGPAAGGGERGARHIVDELRVNVFG